MDRLLAAKMDGEGTDATPESTRHNLLRIGKQYITLGRRTTDFYAVDFDVCHDLYQCYAQLTRQDLEALSSGHPKRFILPMTSTQISTMAVVITQSLFGSECPHKVEGRSPNDDDSAAIMNQLLRWNSERQPTYAIGYMWVIDCLLYNRGIMYEGWQTIEKSSLDPVEEQPEGYKDETGNQLTITRFKRKVTNLGGFNRIHLVSPYDFVVDPALPLYRFQQGRFAGHRTRIPWVELEKRSKLDPTDPMYVLPSSVERLKNYKKDSTVGQLSGPTGSSGTGAVNLMSRTSYERARPSASPMGNDTANKEDGGIVDVYELWVKMNISDYDIDEKDYESGDPKTTGLWQILIGNECEILSASEGFLSHDEFPYSVGEGRPSPHYQFTPSWAMMLKPIQDYVDYLKNRRQEAISNTCGNIFIVDPAKVDIDDFKDPNKENKFLVLKPEAGSVDLNTVVKQVAINDITANFMGDLEKFLSFADTVSGATQPIQGASNDDPATNSANASQMAMGRLSNIARCLSVQALVPQCRRIVSNFQQFLDNDVYIKVKGDYYDLPDTVAVDQGRIKVTRDTIQGEFDFIPHDGMLPTSDAKQLAGLIRTIEAAQAFPMIFDPTQEGALDIKKLFADALKLSGVRSERYYISKADAAKNQAKLQGGAAPAPAAAPGVPPPDAGLPPAGAAPSTEPRAEDLGNGLKSPDLSFQPLVPEVRPGNV
jgi:hypothetical protein